MEKRRGPEHMSAPAAADAHKNSRVRESTRKWWRWAIDLAAVGGVLLAAGHFLVPVLPLAYTTKIALSNLGSLLGKIGLVAGGVIGVGALGKTAADVAAPAPSGGH